MTKRLERCVLVFRPDGDVYIEGVDLTTYEDGAQRYESPRPVLATDPEFAAFADRFGLEAIAQRDSARTELDSAHQQIAALTQARDTLQATLDSTIAERAATLAARDATIDTLKASKQAADEAHAAQVAELQATIDALTNPPVNPRRFSPREFANGLLGQSVMLAAWGSDNPGVALAAMNLLLAEYVDLDDPETAQLLGVLAQAGILTTERVAEILAVSAG